MADSTGMTIEFLRARLLLERSISKTAKQKADGLAKRVVELEEQLKHSTLQRKKAEKATSEVLAILESHGISDLSEVYDSSSDQEEDGKESKEVNNVKREEGKFHESSKSERGSFPSLGRSLSWKSCSGSLENTKARRRSSLISSAESSPRRRVGKSCRQIKQRKSRSDEIGVKDEIPVETQENTVITKKRSTIMGLDGSGKSPKMEKALKYQSRLIDQFEEAQENAQREWEEKFKEINCYSPDSIEHGNQSDVTEERDDIRADTSSEAAHTTSPLLAEQGNSATEQSTTKGNPNPNKIPPTKHQSREEVEPNSRSNETQKEEWFENNSSYSASHASSSKETENFSTGIGSKSKPCTKFFSTSGCPFGESCHFLHYVPGGINTLAHMANHSHPPSSRNNPMTSPPMGGPNGIAAAVKTRMCNKINTPEGCKFGDKCHFAHSERELGKSMGPPPQGYEGMGRFQAPQDAAAASFGATATAKISVDASLAGAIIGKGGVNSKAICRATGAKLSIRDNESDPSTKNIELEGTFDQIKQASGMVRELIVNISSSGGGPPPGMKSSSSHGGGGGGGGGHHHHAPSANNFKTKLCENFAKGACTFGERCHFAHGENELRKSAGM